MQIKNFWRESSKPQSVCGSACGWICGAKAAVCVTKTSLKADLCRYLKRPSSIGILHGDLGNRTAKMANLSYIFTLTFSFNIFLHSDAFAMTVLKCIFFLFCNVNFSFTLRSIFKGCSFISRALLFLLISLGCSSLFPLKFFIFHVTLYLLF